MKNHHLFAVTAFGNDSEKAGEVILECLSFKAAAAFYQ